MLGVGVNLRHRGSDLIDVAIRAEQHRMVQYDSAAMRSCSRRCRESRFRSGCCATTLW